MYLPVFFHGYSRGFDRSRFLQDIWRMARYVATVCWFVIRSDIDIKRVWVVSDLRLFTITWNFINFIGRGFRCCCGGNCLGGNIVGSGRLIAIITVND